MADNNCIKRPHFGCPLNKSSLIVATSIKRPSSTWYTQFGLMSRIWWRKIQSEIEDDNRLWISNVPCICSYVSAKDYANLRQNSIEQPTSINLWSPNTDQDQISPNNIHTLSRDKFWELIKWSHKRKCLALDLLSNSLNSFFKEMYRDQFREFVCGYWGLTGLSGPLPLPGGWLLYEGSTEMSILKKVLL